MGVVFDSPEAAAATAEALAVLRARPGFPAAVRHAARAGLSLYETDPIRRLVISDRGRFVFMNGALHLHFNTAGGLTASGLRDSLALAGIAGPNRAAAVIALLRWGGYLEAAPGGDRRRRVLRPTPVLIETFREMVRDQFTALATAAPDYAHAPALLDAPAFFAGFLARQYRGFTAGFRLTGLAPGSERFVDSNCGMPLLLSLYLADTPPSVSALARRFGVSRAHVLRLLGEAEAMGLATRQPALQALPPLEDMVAGFFGGGMLFNAACIADVLRETSSEAPDAASGGPSKHLFIDACVQNERS